jgi:hypothetical protein
LRSVFAAQGPNSYRGRRIAEKNSVSPIVTVCGADDGTSATEVRVIVTSSFSV